MNIGDRVKVVRPGAVYDCYDSMARRLQLKNWYAYFKPEEGATGTVVAIEKHTQRPDNELVYAVQLDCGTAVLMTPYGIETDEGGKRRQRRETENRRRRENYRSNKRLLGAINRLWPDSGIALTTADGVELRIDGQEIGEGGRRKVIYHYATDDSMYMAETDMSAFLRNRRYVSAKWSRR
jgi:hypothetical protein